MKNLIFFYLLFLSLHVSYSQKILFVGNSLTYQNGMPLILEEIGSNFGKEIITEMICKPNYAIIDHLEEGIVQKELEKKSYDLVIIQQGPSSQILGRKMLIEDGEKLANICKTNNTKLGYFMVWPSKQYYFTFSKVIANYKAGAEHNNAILFPVGKIWRAYEKAKNKISLYSNDNFHPSKVGSFCANRLPLPFPKSATTNHAILDSAYRTAKAKAWCNLRAIPLVWLDANLGWLHKY